MCFCMKMADKIRRTILHELNLKNLIWDLKEKKMAEKATNWPFLLCMYSALQESSYSVAGNISLTFTWA